MIDIYFFIGTKAQAIKCLPLIKRLSTSSNFKVSVVDSGQHVEIVKEIFKELNSSVQKFTVFKNNKNISTFKDSFYWLLNFIYFYLFKKNKSLPDNLDTGICVVHGDTLSTLLGLFWGKRYKLDILHLESGLTSKKLIYPFPEEIIRRIVSRYSDILICFDDEAFKNSNHKYKNSNKHIQRISENTILETLKIKNEYKPSNIATVTLHRTENIFSKKKLKLFVNFLSKLSKTHTVNWYLHEPTKNYLEKYGINIPKSVYIHNLMDHDNFLNEIIRSEIVITDGGSIQEECYFLGKKTIVWRDSTERRYAMNNNMFISNYRVEESLRFVHQSEIKNEKKFSKELSPSREIEDFLLKTYK